MIREFKVCDLCRDDTVEAENHGEIELKDREKTVRFMVLNSAGTDVLDFHTNCLVDYLLKKLVENGQITAEKVKETAGSVEAMITPIKEKP